MTTKTLSDLVQQKAYRIVYWQFIGIGIITLIAFLINGMQSSLSVLAGGLVYGLPNLVFVWRVFRYAGAAQMNLFLAAFIIGETIKLILSGIIFVLVVKYLPVSLLSVLAGLAGSIAAFWIVCFWQFSGKNNSNSSLNV